MPTKPRREDIFIERFLAAYENDSWADAKIEWSDKLKDEGVDALAKRKSDGKTLAIEHTIIEPFVNEKQDFAFFEEADFRRIEQDNTLLVPGKWIQVFIPVGTLRGQREQASLMVDSVRGWLGTKRLSLPDGFSEHQCTIGGISSKPEFEITLTIEVVPLSPGPGKLHVRRQAINSNLGEVVEKALRKKVPKLVKTKANKRLLMLERQHMNLLPQAICGEIEKRKANFAELAKVDEIWIVETIFYGTAFGGSYLRFERYEKGSLISSLDFDGAKPLTRFEGEIDETVIQEAPA